MSQIKVGSWVRVKKELLGLNYVAIGIGNQKLLVTRMEECPGRGTGRDCEECPGHILELRQKNGVKYPQLYECFGYDSKYLLELANNNIWKGGERKRGGIDND